MNSNIVTLKGLAPVERIPKPKIKDNSERLDEENEKLTLSHQQLMIHASSSLAGITGCDEVIALHMECIADLQKRRDRK